MAETQKLTENYLFKMLNPSFAKKKKKKKKKKMKKKVFKSRIRKIGTRDIEFQSGFFKFTTLRRVLWLLQWL